MKAHALARIASGAGFAAIAVLMPTASSAVSTVQAKLFASPPNLTATSANLQFYGFNASNFPTLPAGATLTQVQLTLKGTTSGSFVSENFAPFSSTVQGTGGTFDITSNAVRLGQGNNNSAGTVPAGNSGAGGAPAGTFTSTITSTQQTYVFDIWRANPLIPNTSPFSTAASWTTATVNVPTTCGFTPLYSPGGPFLSTNNCLFTIDTAVATDPSFLQGSFLTYTYTEVPSPLPILGAGAAFGWSRRLRKRIVQRG